jgi:hypothetical protein
VLASGLIIIASSVLFLYWFRYTCLLLLAQKDAQYAFQVASNIKLSFPQVQAALKTPAHSSGMDGLRERLDQDYHLLTELLSHPGSDSMEHRILRFDYRVMRVWYQLTRTSRALVEMSSILGYFAAEIGESAAA